MYWVMFDEPKRDVEGDSLYSVSEVLEQYVEPRNDPGDRPKWIVVLLALAVGVAGFWPYLVIALPMLAFIGFVGAIYSLIRRRLRTALAFGLVCVGSVVTAILLYYVAR